MGVKLNRNGNSLLQIADQTFCLIGSQQSGHILDADGVGSRRLDPLRIVHIILVGEHRAGGVGNGHLRVRALLLGSLDRCLKVLDIVQRVENTDDINTVCDGALYKVFQNVIRVMTVAQHILAAEQHLQLRVGAHLTDGAESVPRILVEEAQAGVERCAAPALQRMEADLVHLLQNGNHVANRHSCCNQRLVRVTQHRLGNPDLLCHILSLLFESM